jgi:hypothetical protein
MTGYIVEFVGGPFDGYRQAVSIPPDDLAPQLALPVNRTIFRLFEGRMPAKGTPITSIAFYRQDVSHGCICYRFLAARSPIRVPNEGQTSS